MIGSAFPLKERACTKDRRVGETLQISSPVISSLWKHQVWDLSSQEIWVIV